MSKDTSQGRRRRCVPEITALEPRALLSVNGNLGSITVVPRFLPNTPDGRQVPVHVSGILGSNHPTTPDGFFFVIDQFRSDEPRGHLHLVPLGASPKYKGWYIFGYDFTVSLQAKEFGGSTHGRFYNLFVGATDNDGASGRYVRILVPENAPARPAVLHPVRLRSGPHPHPLAAARPPRAVH